LSTDFVATWLATGLGTGYAPLPGTAGALLGLALALGIARLRLGRRLVVTLLLVILAIPICSTGASYFGGDDHRIVADEMLTLPVATLATPITRHPGMLAGTFLASRLLDGLKPPPAGWMDASHGAVSIVLDDVVSNVWTLALALAAWHWLRRRSDTDHEKRL
jgi:phosphatidylglycerophosphatase A